MDLNSQPLGIPGGKNLHRNTVGGVRAQHRGVVAVGIGLYILGFDRQRGAALLLFVQRERHTDHTAERLAGFIGGRTGELDQPWEIGGGRGRGGFAVRHLSSSQQGENNQRDKQTADRKLHRNLLVRRILTFWKDPSGGPLGNSEP